MPNTSANQPTQTPTQPAGTEPADALPTQTAEDAEYVPAADQEIPEPLPALLQAAMTGAVKFYRVRASGSLRAVPYLPEGTEAREVADWIANEVEEGKSVAQVAFETGLSNATVRRAIACVELADDLHDGELSEIYEEGVDAIYLSALQDPANVQFEVVDGEDK
jgi:hypothetical protein